VLKWTCLRPTDGPFKSAPTNVPLQLVDVMLVVVVKILKVLERLLMVLDPRIPLTRVLLIMLKIAFSGSGSALTGITTTISQGSKSITLSQSDSACGSGYMSAFGGVLKAGMVPVWSYWTGNMAWLDSPACSNENNEVAGNFIFSNLVVSGTVGKTTGPPSQPPSGPPAPPGTPVCGTSGTTTNQYWVEFKAPSGVDGSKTSASVKCTSGSCQACTWFASGGKYQCSCPGSGCTNPTITVGGKACVLSASALTEDTMANSSTMDQPMIIGVSVVAAVLVITIIVIVVIYLKKKGSPEIA